MFELEKPVFLGISIEDRGGGHFPIPLAPYRLDNLYSSRLRAWSHLAPRELKNHGALFNLCSERGFTENTLTPVSGRPLEIQVHKDQILTFNIQSSTLYSRELQFNGSQDSSCLAKLKTTFIISHTPDQEITSSQENRSNF